MKDFYKIAHECRNADSTRFWQMFAVMTTVNAALFALVGTQRIDTRFVPWCGALGAIVSLLFWGMQVRYTWWVKHWEEKLREFEPIIRKDIASQRATAGLDPLPQEPALFLEKEKPRPVGLSTRVYSNVVAVLFIVIWIVAAVVSAWR